MNIEVFLPGLSKSVLISEDKFGRVMSLTGRRFLIISGAIRFQFKSKTVSLSRYVIGCPRNRCVDHRNHNQFDLSNENLRIASYSQNGANRIKNKGKLSSQFKGVDFYIRNNKWRSQILVKGKKIHLGYFSSEVDAAIAYNNAAIRYFDKFAHLNTLPDGK